MTDAESHSPGASPLAPCHEPTIEPARFPLFATHPKRDFWKPVIDSFGQAIAVPPDARIIVELSRPPMVMQESKMTLVLDIGRWKYLVISADYDGSHACTSNHRYEIVESFCFCRLLSPHEEGCLDAMTKPRLGMIPDITFWIKAFDFMRTTWMVGDAERMLADNPLNHIPLYAGYDTLRNGEDHLSVLVYLNRETNDIVHLAAAKNRSDDSVYGLFAESKPKLKDLTALSPEIKGAVLWFGFNLECGGVSDSPTDLA